MSRRKIFTVLRSMHLAFDRLLIAFASRKIRHTYIRMSSRIKTSLFPNHDTYVPGPSEGGPIPRSATWMPPPIPGWVLDEMKNLARDIDPVLYPTDEFLANCRYYSFPVIPSPGKIYRELMEQCTTNNYSHCFAIPWIKRGGADLVILKHIEMTSCTPGCKVLVILTEPGDSPWLSRIPDGVDIMDASRFEGEIAHEELLLVLARILIQLHIGTLHIINSRHVWEVACRYGLAVSQQTSIFASIYCDDVDRYGQPVGFARQYLPKTYQWLTKVLCDNHAFPELLCKTYGYRSDLFHVLKSPIADSLLSRSVRKPKGRRVLWAGRLDRQKRPDLLLAIAKSLPDVEFHIYGETLFGDETNVGNKLKKVKNIRMLGGFDGVESLPFETFPVFLFTSQWEGTPTIIIAAALASIPIVASCVGGVGDIVTESRGYPVSEIENVALYVARISEALDSPLQAEGKAERASEYVRTEHTDASFAQALAASSGYMPSSAIASTVTLRALG